MRASAILTGLAVLTCTAARTEDLPGVAMNSRIENVVLYSSGAAVTRGAEGTIPEGRSRLTIAGLPPALEAGTLKARLEAPASARILSVDYRVEPRVKPGREDEKRLVERLNELDLKLKVVNDERALLNGKAEFINEVSLPPRPADKKVAPTEAPKLEMESWAPVLDFSEKELATVLERLRELGDSAKKLEGEIKRTKAELTKLRSQTVPAVASAIIEVGSPAAGDVRLLLTYSVTNAAWYPAYSFRVDPAAGTAEMIRYASCAQNTGENWEGVDMVFSSSEERRVVSLPELKTWLIVERVTGGGIEPPRAGDQEPGEEVIGRPGDLPAASTAFVQNPLSALGFLGAGRLGDAFGYQGLGSLGRTYKDLKGRRDIPLGGTSVVGSLGVGGGGAGCYGFRTGGGRRRAVLRGGGSRRSESACSMALDWLPKRQEPDGSWSSRGNGGGLRMDEADTALALLSMLGAGHTEKAGRYRKNVARAISYLRSRQAADGSIGSDLWTRALTTCALSEAYGMGRIPATGRMAQRAATALARDIASSPWPLQSGLTGREWPDGPSNLAFVTLAFKSAMVARLNVGNAAMMQLMSMLDDLESGPPDPLGSAAAMVIRLMLGFKRMHKDVVRCAKTLLANLPEWEHGRMDFRYFYLGTLGMFQVGGNYWKKWNLAIRDMLIARQIRGGEHDGAWPLADIVATGGGIPGRGASRVYTTAILSMCLEVYYRYLPLYKGSGGGSGPAGVEQRYTPPIISSVGRDFRSRSLQPENLASDGKFRLVAVERKKLRPRIFDLAVPVEYRGAFLQAEVENSAPEPLLAGEARIYMGTDFLGVTFLDTVEAGGKFVIPLGLDSGIKLARHSKSERSEVGFLKRVRRTEYNVTLEAANHKNRAVELVIVDRVPCPSDERIRLKDVFFWGASAAYDPEDPGGEVRLTLKIGPGQAKSVNMQYAIEHSSKIEAVGRRGN